jgi:hypothetical protein
MTSPAGIVALDVPRLRASVGVCICALSSSGTPFAMISRGARVA